MTTLIPERIAWAVEQVVARPVRRILEVGCGSGHAVALLLARLPRAVVTAIDRSALQVGRARARNEESVEQGRARIDRMTLAEAPGSLGTGAFDAALAVNVNAFWTAPAPAPSLAALGRLLRPGGRAYLVYEPPSRSGLDVLRDRLASVLDEHGFETEDIRESGFRVGHALCIVGRTPTPSASRAPRRAATHP